MRTLLAQARPLTDHHASAPLPCLSEQFAGLFFNHGDPPLEELERLERYGNDIIEKGCTGTPAQDEELCTTVDAIRRVSQQIDGLSISKRAPT
jgi:hypothetical protein